MKEIFGIGLITIVILVFGYGLSWLITCGIIKLITMCFGWSFKSFSFELAERGLR